MYLLALEVLTKINSHGFKSYIVGGYPRDLYLNRESLDIDICTDATPKEINEIFSGSVMSKQMYGSVTVIYKKVRFEITTFRKEFKYENNRFPIKIKYIELLENDLKRRDFTINTMCIDSKGNIYDFYNSKEDIENKVIKTVGPSDNKIKTDILRSLRAIRFATILEFNLDDKLKKSIKKYGYLLKKLSYYRKKEELDKIFNSTNNKYGIKLLKELNLSGYLNLGKLDIVPTTSAIGIWAQLNIEEYPFTKGEKEIIDNIKEALSKELNDHNLYKYGLYVWTIIGEIKNINRSILVTQYNSLPIKCKNDIDIKPNDICEILNKKPDKFIKEILNDLEYKILLKDLSNEFIELKKYILSNYI